MMMPSLPPQDQYQLGRELWNAAGSRRTRRHISSLDLHELGGEHDALRPAPVWMAIRRLVERVERLAVVQRFQGWLERPASVESIPARREEACVHRGEGLRTRPPTPGEPSPS